MARVDQPSLENSRIEPETLKILVNGEAQETTDVKTVADLLRTLDIPSEQVAVEVNLELVPRAKHATHPLTESDQVEVVRLVGGG